MKLLITTEQPSSENGGSELRRRRNVTRSDESVDEHCEMINTSNGNGPREDGADLLSELELERRSAEYESNSGLNIHHRNSNLCSTLNFPNLVETNGHQHKREQEQPNVKVDNDQCSNASSTTDNNGNDESEIVRVSARKPTAFDYVCMELSRRYSLHNEKEQYAEKRRKVYAFLQIPIELEAFIYYGFCQCLDAFCHIFTFLPIRVLFNLIGCTFQFKRWSAADTCDILKLIIIICSSWFMKFVDTSVVYHRVRSQSVIKLYIFYNMLEVADKLFSSFGQDILDALLWTASERGTANNKKFFSIVFHLLFAIVYALCHTLIILLQATTLNVAFNSHNQSLLTIMMSNNFVELKGAVFKKFGKPNLFQMSCSDVRERFHTVILLVVVVLRNMTAVNWKWENLNNMTPDLVWFQSVWTALTGTIVILIAELIVDSLKHAFITRFNEISPFVYREYKITISYDVIRTHEMDSFSDFSDQVSRRMGFVPIPVTILLIRVICQSVDFGNAFSIALLVCVWVLLLFVKVINGVSLYSKAIDQVKKQKASENDEGQFNFSDEPTRLFPSMFPL